MRVLFFDSGMGGLTVMAAVKARCPQLEYAYLFDNAAFPYGDKSEDFLIDRVDLLLKEGYSRLKPDLIVVACNTASTVVLPVLRHDLPVPIVGVVPAIKPAAKLSRRGIIGLLATPGTVKRAYTDHLIAQFAADVKVLRLGTTELVEEAERKLQGQTVNMKRLTAVLKPWTDLQEDLKPDMAVLGCTHFPLLKDEIGQILGQKCTLIDSGDAIARRVESLLDINHQSAVDGSAVKNQEKRSPCCVFCTKEDGSLPARELMLKSWGISKIEVLSIRAKLKNQA